MHLLIIEDNPTTTRYLKKGFEEHFFAVTVANDGQEGLFLAREQVFDLIIADVMMPKINGWEVVERLRKDDESTPVLLLTACDDVDSRVKGFQTGADDYLVKPFAFSELLARVNALLKRSLPRTSDKQIIADLIIDTKKHKVFRNQKSIALSAKEFMLLSFLADRQGEVLSRSLIAERVWDINFDADTNVIDVAIKRLRDKLDRGFGKSLIHTIRGVGYVLEER